MSRRLVTKRTKVVVAGAMVVLSMTLFHRPILRQVGGGLVVDEGVREAAGVFLLRCDRNYAIGAELVHNGQVTTVYLVREPSLPLQEAGIARPEHERLQEELVKLDVPAERIVVTDRENHDLWTFAETVQATVSAESDQSFLILADVFQTGRVDFVLDRTLEEAQRARVRIVPVRDRRFDETNWWRNRLGIKSVVDSYIRLVHMVCIGRPEEVARPEALTERLEAARS